MSAQVVAALRKRAAQLEDEAHDRLTAHGPGGDPLVLSSKVRSPEHLMVLAAEFTALADLAEGLEDEGDGSHSDSG